MERAQSFAGLLPVVRAAAIFLAGYRLFGVSLAGGGDLLISHVPSVALIGLAVVPTAWVQVSVVAFALVMLVAAVGCIASIREAVLFAGFDVQLLEAFVMGLFIALYATLRFRLKGIERSDRGRH